VAKAAAPVAAVPQAQEEQWKNFKSSVFGSASNAGILNMGGVSYLPATAGTTTYLANTLVSH
jgi:O-antigen/teichoic acid export membrane protein